MNRSSGVWRVSKVHKADICQRFTLANTTQLNRRLGVPRRMRAVLKNKGAQEFLAVFDELQGKQRAVTPAVKTQTFGFVPKAFRSQN